LEVNEEEEGLKTHYQKQVAASPAPRVASPALLTAAQLLRQTSGFAAPSEAPRGKNLHRLVSEMHTQGAATEVPTTNPHDYQ